MATAAAELPALPAAAVPLEAPARPFPVYFTAGRFLVWDSRAAMSLRVRYRIFGELSEEMAENTVQGRKRVVRSMHYRKAFAKRVAGRADRGTAEELEAAAPGGRHMRLDGVVAAEGDEDLIEAVKAATDINVRRLNHEMTEDPEPEVDLQGRCETLPLALSLEEVLLLHRKGWLALRRGGSIDEFRGEPGSAAAAAYARRTAEWREADLRLQRVEERVRENRLDLLRRGSSNTDSEGEDGDAEAAPAPAREEAEAAPAPAKEEAAPDADADANADAGAKPKAGRVQSKKHERQATLEYPERSTMSLAQKVEPQWFDNYFLTSYMGAPPTASVEDLEAEVGPGAGVRSAAMSREEVAGLLRGLVAEATPRAAVMRGGAGDLPHPLLRSLVYQDLWEKGYYMTCGLKFGCDFLVYPGSPMEFHSRWVCAVVPWVHEVMMLDMLAWARLGTAVKKAVLLASALPSRLDGEAFAALRSPFLDPEKYVADGAEADDDAARPAAGAAAGAHDTMNDEYLPAELRGDRRVRSSLGGSERDLVRRTRYLTMNWDWRQSAPMEPGGFDRPRKVREPRRRKPQQQQQQQQPKGRGKKRNDQGPHDQTEARILRDMAKRKKRRLTTRRKK